VGLDDPLDHPPVLGPERTVKAADDPRRQSPLETERVADRQDLLPDEELGRFAQGHRHQAIGRDLDPDHRHVVRGVLADDLGAVPSYRITATASAPSTTW